MSDRAWKLIAGRFSTVQEFEGGATINWRDAEWVIYSDEEPVLGDKIICIEDLPYEVEPLSMYGGNLEGIEEDDLEESIVDATHVWNYRVEEMA